MTSRATYMDRILYATIAGLFLLSGAILVAACGGGSTATSGTTRGAITGFGSVFVNGIEFQTNDLTHRRRLDDGPGDIPGRDDEVFRVGMIVTVHHGADDIAEEIEFDDNLEGPAAGLSGGSFNVLGQPVVFDNATMFEFSGGAALANGAIVEVSGLSDASGTIHATFIEVKPAGSRTTFEIKGFVSNVTSSTFDLGPIPGTATITVNYSSAALRDLPGGLANGAFVEVKTTSTASPITATSVEGKEDIGHGLDDMPGHT